MFTQEDVDLHRSAAEEGKKILLNYFHQNLIEHSMVSSVVYNNLLNNIQSRIDWHESMAGRLEILIQGGGEEGETPRHN